MMMQTRMRGAQLLGLLAILVIGWILISGPAGRERAEKTTEQAAPAAETDAANPDGASRSPVDAAPDKTHGSAPRTGWLLGPDQRLLDHANGDLYAPALPGFPVDVEGGRFALPSSLPPGALADCQPESFLFIDARGESSRPSTIAFGNDADAVALRLGLPAAAEFSIRVLDFQGAPIEGALLTPGLPTFVRESSVLRTDASGHAVVSVRSATGDRFRLRVKADGYLHASVSLEKARVDEELVVTLGRILAAGVVIDERYAMELGVTIGNGAEGSPHTSPSGTDWVPAVRRAEARADLAPWERVRWYVIAETGPESTPEALSVSYRALGKSVGVSEVPFVPVTDPGLRPVRPDPEFLAGLSAFPEVRLEFRPNSAFRAGYPDEVRVVFDVVQENPQPVYRDLIPTLGADDPPIFATDGVHVGDGVYAFRMPPGDYSPKSQPAPTRDASRPVFLPQQRFTVGVDGYSGVLLLHPDECYVAVDVRDPHGFPLDIATGVRRADSTARMSFLRRSTWPKQMWVRPGSYELWGMSETRLDVLATQDFPSGLREDGTWWFTVDIDAAGFDAAEFR